MDHLYLGSVGAAYSLNVLKSLNISYILTVCECLPPKFPNEFTYKVISVTDDPSTQLKNYFNEALDFIRNAINQGKNILVHCFAGVSRSASIVIAYLIKYHHLDYIPAYNLVRIKRPWINPNHGFQGQLKRFAKSIRTKI